MNHPKILFWSVFIVSPILFFAPMPATVGSGLGLDKLAHILIFMALETLVLWSYPLKKSFSTVAIIFYAPIVEVIQGYLLTYRSFGWYDMLAGWAGVVLGVCFFASFGDHVNKKNSI